MTIPNYCERSIKLDTEVKVLKEEARVQRERTHGTE